MTYSWGRIKLGFATEVKHWAPWRNERGRSSTPSYSQEVSSRGKKPLEVEKGLSGGDIGNIDDEKEQNNKRGEEKVKEKEEKDKKHEAENKKQKGPCKPKAEVTPRVVLNDPALQAHREHICTYAIIWKFMGLWPMKKVLQALIKYHWKPKGGIDLHLGSKGFFTVVFTNIEDKDKVFEGGPYFYAAAGLYMWP